MKTKFIEIKANILKSFNFTRKMLSKFLHWQERKFAYFILKILILVAAIGGCVILYNFFSSLTTLIIFFGIMFADRLESAFNASYYTMPQEFNLSMQNNACANLLFGIMQKYSSVFNVVKPKAISDVLPDITRYSNPQTLDNLTFFRYPIKALDECMELDYQSLTDTLNILIAQKIQNSEVENIPFAFYNDVTAIQVIKISLDAYNPSFITFDFMFLDTLQKYEFIQKKKQIAKAEYCPAPLDEDF